MKFNLNDFLQLDTNGLLAVNGGSGCSSGPSSSSSDSSGGSSSSGNSSVSSSGSGSSTTETVYVPTGPYNGYLVTKTKKGRNYGTSSGTVSSSGGGSCSSSCEGVASTTYQTGGSSSSGGHGCSGGGICGRTSNSGYKITEDNINKSIQERIQNAVNKIGFKSYETADENGINEYRCDQYVADILEQSGFNVENYCVDDPAGKDVDQHVKDMLDNEVAYQVGTGSLETGASYVVFMVDADNELESHTGIIMNGGASGYCFIDNSSSNDIPGTETHKGSSLRGVLSPYSRYENMYFVKLK